MEILSLHPDPQKLPSSKIKPIKYRQSKTIDPQTIAKYLIYRPKNLRTTYSPLSNHDYKPQSIKKPSKIFKTQDVISRASYSLDNRTAFQNAYFSSMVKSLSASLSSFELEEWDQINEERSKVISKSLASLKNLRDIDIQFYFCQFPAPNDLHSLFKRLSYFKKMDQLTFATLQCYSFEPRHLNALCSSLIRSTQLQSLDLTFDGDDQLLNTLIPVLSRLTSLKKICLNLEGENQIQAETIIKLFMALSTRKSLIDITLLMYSCEIACENTSLEPFAEGLQYLNPSSITKLSLHLFQNLTSEGLTKISQALSKFTSLEKLRIDVPDSPEITNKGLAQLSATLKGLISLTSLTLSFSGFTDDLALALKSLSKLIHLKLSFQHPHPSRDQIRQLSSSITALKASLKFLDIRV